MKIAREKQSPRNTPRTENNLISGSIKRRTATKYSPQRHKKPPISHIIDVIFLSDSSPIA
ncbi:MAG: hypothetical protein SOV55_00815 [Candidatus Borkfalkiaceae bacterium]|nr:hypothetical protein [bacterium]MDY2850657.1 hypothetical protein [Christensenellaceae bacterium]